MFLTEPQERDLRSALRVTRFIAFAMCLGGPAVYALVYGLAVLNGQWGLFFKGFGAVPWKEPLVLGLLAVAATTLGGSFVLPGILLGQQPKSLAPLTALRTRSILSCALLEAVAIYGLVLGFLLGPSVASLALTLMLIPPCFGLLRLPSEPAWREFCERSRMGDGHA